MLATQQELSNWYQSVYFHDSHLADAMYNDVQAVALWALGANKSGGQEAATRLREATRPLPVIFGKILDSILSEMGYS